MSRDCTDPFHQHDSDMAAFARAREERHTHTSSYVPGWYHYDQHNQGQDRIKSQSGGLPRAYISIQHTRVQVTSYSSITAPL